MLVMIILKLTTIIILGLISVYMIRKIRISNDMKAVISRRKKTIEIRSRKEILKQLTESKFDILIIGGGITGSGVALDAATRGLKVALIERFDFGSETSSKTTKLLHGGFRYLLKAFSDFSILQLLVVIRGLSERKSIMIMAPYLTYTVKIIIPIYRAILTPYYCFISKLYDWLSWGESLGRSHLVSKEQSLAYYYNLPKNNLSCSMAYYDGMMQDARINVLVAKTASHYGAIIANYVEFIKFNKDENGMNQSATCKNLLTNETFEIRATIFISATGCFTDQIRKYDNPKDKEFMDASVGTHIVLDAQFGPENIGILDSKTSDGRVAFILPWKGYKLVGTTENKGAVVPTICPTKDDLHFLIKVAQKFSSEKITLKNVRSAWAGIRPLISKSKQEKTESIVRFYEVIDDEDGLISVTGGKWTMFRLMAEKTIDLAIKKYGLKPLNCCVTKKLRIVGSKGYARNLYIKVARVLEIDIEYAKHLILQYGDKAFKVGKYLKEYPEKLSSKYLFTVAEAIYCVENEYACTSIDIVNNRFELGFYDSIEALRMKEKLDLILEEYYKSKGEKYMINSKYSDRIFKSMGIGLLQEN